MITQWISGARSQPKRYITFGYVHVQYTTQSISVVAAAVTLQTIEGVVRYMLKDTAAVAALCSDRIYWLKTPQKPTLPYVVYHATSDPHDAQYLSPAGTYTKAGQRHFNFACISDDSLESLDLQQTLMNTLRGAQGTTCGFTIEIVTIENMRHRVDPVADVYVNDVDAIVEYYEK